MDKVIHFNFSEPVDVPTFMALCSPEDIRWLSRDEVTKLKYSTVKSLYATKMDFTMLNRLTLTQDDADYFRYPNYYEIEPTVLDSYRNLGIKTGDLFLDKPEAVRDIVRAFKNGEDVDAVVVKYLGDTIDYSNYSSDEARQG